MPHSNGSTWRSKRAVLVSLVAVVLLGIASSVVFWIKERRPAVDLRVSFHIPLANPTAPAIAYQLRNLGRQPVMLRGVGLLEIAGNPPIINDSDNIDWCDKVDATALKPPGQITPQATQTSAAGQKREQYAPASVSVAGKASTSDSPIEIAGGRSLTVAATFRTDPQQARGESNQVFCPIIWLAPAAQETGTAVCQGFAVATNNGGVSNTIVARQFQILPASTGASCPVAPQ